MTSKERVQNAISHRQPDRVPVGLRFVPEVLEKLLIKLTISKAEFLRITGEDLACVRPKFKNSASGFFYADPTVEITPEGELIDIWGVPFTLVKTGFQNYVELAGRPPLAGCEDINILKHYRWPEPAVWDYSNINNELESNKDKCTWGHTRGFFEIAHFMRGMDNFLIDLAVNEDFACVLMDHICEYLLDKTERILKAGKGRFVMFEYNDDIASQNSLLISPQMWKKLIKPRMAKFFKLIHDYGAKVRYHSCGSCYAIIPDLIEIGLDVLNPVQPNAQNMDPYKLKNEFGSNLTFHGGIDTQHLMPNARAGEVFMETEKIIEQVGKNGGYILGTGHYIQGDVPFDNICALIEAGVGCKLN